MNINKQIEKILAGFWLEDYDSDEAISQIKKTILKAIEEKKRVRSAIEGAYRVEVPYVLFDDIKEVLS